MSADCPARSGRGDNRSSCCRARKPPAFRRLDTALLSSRAGLRASMIGTPSLISTTDSPKGAHRPPAGMFGTQFAARRQTIRRRSSRGAATSVRHSPTEPSRSVIRSCPNGVATATRLNWCKPLFSGRLTYRKCAESWPRRKSTTSHQLVCSPAAVSEEWEQDASRITIGFSAIAKRQRSAAFLASQRCRFSGWFRLVNAVPDCGEMALR